ncbi:NAD-dependent epimerase/dehydratase family protein [Pelagibius sp.]|uniref:NAD-dependent epimerase/dehydratase family protein n=1 Tax=Pelagibius sp. TaxID=1931238 RepID=UPI003B50EBC7
MKALVTGSSGHLGEALVRTLRGAGHNVLGLDILPSPFTDRVASVTDREAVRQSMARADVVFHTATLHKPHVVTHSRQDFVDTNITGTLNLLEEAVEVGVEAFIFTSTTSVFGDALVPGPGEPAAWITEDVVPQPKNIYGATKAAAEDLCQLFHRNQGLACLALRTSRFFPEEDDSAAVRDAYADENIKTNELLYRRADLADIVDAHLAAARRAPEIGFGRYIISATSPFAQRDLAPLRGEAAAVIGRLHPEAGTVYDQLGWRLPDAIDRVYVNARARRDLGWRPRYDFARAIALLRSGQDPRSPLARLVGSKGYHAETFDQGPYPVEEDKRRQG